MTTLTDDQKDQFRRDGVLVLESAVITEEAPIGTSFSAQQANMGA